ncbi:MAG: primase [Frankiales bacterium]|nr:primase [Frankiales bacterium]
MRTLVRSTLLAGFTGTLMVSVAWAGVGLAPVPSTPPLPLPLPVAVPQQQEVSAATGAAPAPTRPVRTGLRVGAARTSIAPRPDAAKGDRWETDLTKCVRLTSADVMATLRNLGDHAASTGTPWPENPDCIYQGGYGLGPNFPVSTFDRTLGLWVRAMAVGDGKDTFVLAVVDGEGWLWDYASTCEDCGAKQIGEALAADPALAARGVRAGSFALHATHSHTSPDFLGGWGFVPDWYMAQVTRTIKATVRQAVLAMEPARLEVGSEDARAHNSERRSTYRSAEEPDLNWLRATSADGRRTIATLGAFAAHPVTRDHEIGVAHPDWPGYFARRAEQRFGGVAMHAMTGLGNVTGATDEQRDAAGRVTRPSTGTALADLIPPVGGGRAVRGEDVRFTQRTWRQPVTNVPLDALGTAGFFDRQFDLAPASVSVGESAEAPCTSAAPQSVELPATVLKIGQDVVLTTAPGETFSNLSNTLKEKAPAQVVFPLAQTNDSLGYVPQSFELDPVGQQGLGFAADGYVFVNYEDSYAIDRCVGDMVLEQTLRAMSELR